MNFWSYFSQPITKLDGLMIKNLYLFLDLEDDNDFSFKVNIMKGSRYSIVSANYSNGKKVFPVASHWKNIVFDIGYSTSVRTEEIESFDIIHFNKAIFTLNTDNVYEMHIPRTFVKKFSIDKREIMAIMTPLETETSEIIIPIQENL